MTSSTLDYKIEQVPSDKYFIGVTTENVSFPNIGQEFKRSCNTFIQFLKDNSALDLMQAFSGRYTERENGLNLKVGLFIDEAQVDRVRQLIQQQQEQHVELDLVKSGKYLLYTHVGSYSQLPHVWSSLKSTAQKDSLNLSSEPYSCWETYLNSPKEVDESQLVTQIWYRIDEAQ